MNINPLLLQTETALGVKSYPNVCPDPSDNYIVFEYAGNGEEPVFFADNEALYEITTVRVHWYTKSNPQPLKKKLRRFLKERGFNILDTLEFYEEDTKLNHIVVDCDIDSEINDEE